MSLGSSLYDVRRWVESSFEEPKGSFVRTRIILQTGIDLAAVGPHDPPALDRAKVVRDALMAMGLAEGTPS